ncbi:MAG: peroxiredoxin [Nitrospirales bacterium]|nr:peroxiredoxin [Nitrospirales bacterium]
MEAPEFCLGGIDGVGNEGEFCLSALLAEGRPVVLYFYPRDNTPGCTQEACDFRDNINRIAPHTLVVGVSTDGIASHRKFREKHGLTFPLLSDPEHSVLASYGAWGEKKLYGKLSEGTIRSTFLIGPDGLVKKVWKGVKVKGHVDEVLTFLRTSE